MTSGAIQYGVPRTECMLLAKSCNRRNLVNHILSLSLSLSLSLYLAIFCAAKVYEFYNTSGVDHDIGTLNVTVDDPVAVEIGEGIGDLLSVQGNSMTVQGAKPGKKPRSCDDHVMITLSLPPLDDAL